jgi:hypothetical protein
MRANGREATVVAVFAWTLCLVGCGGHGPVRTQVDEAGACAADDTACAEPCARTDGGCSEAGTDAAPVCLGVLDCAGECNGSARYVNGICRRVSSDRDGGPTPCPSGFCGPQCAERLDCDQVCNGTNVGAFSFRDSDGDGLGDPKSSERHCGTPSAGRVANADDCNDKIAGCRQDCTACRVLPSFALRMKLSAQSPGLQDRPLGPRGVANIGDLDSDGTPDLLIGNSVAFLQPDWTLRAITDVQPTMLDDTLDPSFGSAVAGLGDQNRDGLVEVAIGEPEALTHRGRWWLLSLDARAVVRKSAVSMFTPTNASSQVASERVGYRYGAAMAAIDLDGDKTPELAVSSVNDSYEVFSDIGRIDFFQLATGVGVPLGSIGPKAAPPYTQRQFAYARFAALPDLDQNGVSDMFVGTPRNYNSGSTPGGAWSFLLSNTGQIESSSRLGSTELGGAPFDEEGFAADVAWVGPDKDGYPLVIASHTALTSAGGLVALSLDSFGRHRVSELLRANGHALPFGLPDGRAFGAALEPLGDLNRDGLPELAVTALPGDLSTLTPEQRARDLRGEIYVVSLQAFCGKDAAAGDCNGLTIDGCETALTTDDNCGQCGARCAAGAHARSSQCTAERRCKTVCEDGWLDCNDDPGDGCEVESAKKDSNGHSLGQPRCDQLLCEDGFENCNGKLDDGCEVDRRSDPLNCGVCGLKCPVVNGYSATCTNGGCGSATSAAAPGYSDCDPNIVGFETCGVSCTQGLDPVTMMPWSDSTTPLAQKCAADRQCTLQTPTNAPPYASCVSLCPIDHADCDGDSSGSCETRVDTNANCGGCRRSCQTWGSREYCRLNVEGTAYACQN